ncbi:MAG: AAA family ATPase [Angustibacter sp.]
MLGRSTLMAEVTALRKGDLVTLDDPSQRAAAKPDSVGFFRQFPAGLLAIDEVQRVPELMLALKLWVDRDRRAG